MLGVSRDDTGIDNIDVDINNVVVGADVHVDDINTGVGIGIDLEDVIVDNIDDADVDNVVCRYRCR